MVPVPEVPVGGRSIREVKEGFEVICLCVINVRQLIDTFFGLGQQALLDDLRHVSAGQLHTVIKARLDFREIITFLIAHFAHNVFHLFLGGNDNPGPSPALGGEALGNGLQVGHQLGVVGNVLADLVHKEVQAELFVATLFCLLLDIGIHIVREVLYRNSVFAAVLVEDARC